MKIAGGMNGRFRGEHVNDEQIDAQTAENHFDDHLSGAEPVLVLTAIQHHLQPADAQRQHGKADPVELHVEVGMRARHEKYQAERGEYAERQVDVEHVAPVVQSRSDNRPASAPGSARPSRRRPRSPSPGRAARSDRCPSSSTATAAPVPRRRCLAGCGTPPSEPATARPRTASTLTVKPIRQVTNRYLRPNRAASQPTGAVMIAAAVMYEVRTQVISS